MADDGTNERPGQFAESKKLFGVELRWKEMGRRILTLLWRMQDAEMLCHAASLTKREQWAWLAGKEHGQVDLGPRQFEVCSRLTAAIIRISGAVIQSKL
jgi:hypothetical protein